MALVRPFLLAFRGFHLGAGLRPGERQSGLQLPFRVCSSPRPTPWFQQSLIAFLSALVLGFLAIQSGSLFAVRGVHAAPQRAGSAGPSSAAGRG